MKHLIAAAAALGLVAVAAPAFAETQVGIGYTNLNANSTNLGSIDGSVSWEAATHLGVEGQAGFGVVKDKGFKESYNVAAYGTYTLPVASNFSLKARAGWGDVKIDHSSNQDGFAAGVGAQWLWDASNGIRADYTYQDLDHGHADDFGAAYVHKF